MCPGGDFRNHNGTRENGAYGNKLEDENRQYHGSIILSIANAGSNKNGPFCFCVSPRPDCWMAVEDQEGNDGKYINVAHSLDDRRVFKGRLDGYYKGCSQADCI